jgi:hypothetical protein
MDSTPTSAVTGVTDTRPIRLDRLAATGADLASDSLKHVLPGAEQGRVPVAAFASSI